MQWCIPLRWLSIASLVGMSFLVNASEETTLKEILALPQAPDGVVIEIVTGDRAGLTWALPQSKEYIKQLRAKFKDLPIAIVTHGREQFTLTNKNQDKNKSGHKTVKSLLQDDKVQVHVCGTYASWQGLSDEDFPDYVNVSASGPAQINDYVAVGYLLVVIRSDGAVFD